MNEVSWQTTTQMLDNLKGSNRSEEWRLFNDNFFPLLVNFAKRLGLPAEHVEDAAQETMMSFLRAFREGKYDRKKGRLRHWLYGIARNVILKYSRDLPPERAASDNTPGHSFWDSHLSEEVIHNTWVAEWQQMVLARCLDRAKYELEPRTFKAFELCTFKEMPVDKVAKKLNMTTNGVYVAKNRVVARLRQLEQEFENIPEE